MRVVPGATRIGRNGALIMVGTGFGSRREPRPRRHGGGSYSAIRDTPLTGGDHPWSCAALTRCCGASSSKVCGSSLPSSAIRSSRSATRPWTKAWISLTRGTRRRRCTWPTRGRGSPASPPLPSSQEVPALPTPCRRCRQSMPAKARSSCSRGAPRRGTWAGTRSKRSTRSGWPHRRRIPDMLATAFRTALTGRYGPVHVTLPIDVQEAAVDEDDLPRYSPREYRDAGRPHGDPRLIEDAVTLLQRAQRPVVIAANAARHAVVPATLRDFVEMLEVPCFTVEQARGLLSDDHPLCFGYADPALNDAARHFAEADVVLLLGKRLDHRYRYGLPPFFAPSASLIQIDPAPEEIGRNRGVQLGIAGDPDSVLAQMSAAARGGGRQASPWLAQLARTRDAQRRRFESLATDEAPLHPMRVLREVDAITTAETIIVVDGGDYAGWARSYLRARNPGGWLRIGPLAQLGCGVPYALGAKLARPAAEVVLIVGDGSFGFYAMEYDTAVRHRLSFTAVMGNDALWGIDRNFQLAYYGRATGTELRQVRYDRTVESLGGHGEYVERAADLAPAIERARASGAPALVNVVVRNAPCPLAEAMIARKSGRRPS